MQLTLLREASTEKATPGRLYLDGEPFCYTLEDPVRADPRPETPANEAKIPGRTAIPAGRYEVILTVSPRFGRPLPLLVNVPGFEGVRIHAGNRAEDTEGCILPGHTRGPDFVGRSREAEAALIYRITGARTRGDAVYIDVRNPDNEVTHGQPGPGEGESEGEGGRTHGESA